MPDVQDGSPAGPLKPLEQLFDAIEKCERERIEALLREHPSLVQEPREDWERSTAIHAAAGRADAEMIALLLERGADPAAPDAFGNTPLHRVVTAKASAQAIESCIRLLDERPPGLGAVNHNGHTPSGRPSGTAASRRRRSYGCAARLLQRRDPRGRRLPTWSARSRVFSRNPGTVP